MSAVIPTTATAAAHSAPREATRIPELDGIRGVAILVVVAFHYFWTRIPIPRTGAWAYMMRLGLTGWAGVDLFFVLSGFLIGSIVLGARSAPYYYSTFYARRACRIFPIYFVLVGLTFIGAMLLPASMKPLVGPGDVPWLAYVTFTQNIWMAMAGNMGMIALAITWSLAVEEQFYLLLPVIVRNVKERWLPVLLGVAIVGAPLLRRELANHGLADNAAYVLLPCRADALAWGVLAAWALRREEVRAWCAQRQSLFLAIFAIFVAGFIGLAETGFSQYKRSMLFYGYTWISMSAATMIVIAVTQPDSPVSRVLRTRVLRAWGQVAYGVYLIHATVYWLLFQTGLHQAATTVLAVALTWGLAQASWKWFESPILRLGRRVDYWARPRLVQQPSPSLVLSE